MPMATGIYGCMTTMLTMRIPVRDTSCRSPMPIQLYALTIGLSLSLYIFRRHQPCSVFGCVPLAIPMRMSIILSMSPQRVTVFRTSHTRCSHPYQRMIISRSQSPCVTTSDRQYILPSVTTTAVTSTGCFWMTLPSNWIPPRSCRWWSPTP